MDSLKEFLNNLVNDHLGMTIAAILLFVAIIGCAIILSLKIKNNKKQREQQEYKKELSKISKEELDNIAGNVSNPEILYKSFETETAPKSDSQSSKDSPSAENADGVAADDDKPDSSEDKSNGNAENGGVKSEEAAPVISDAASDGITTESGTESENKTEIIDEKPAEAEMPATEKSAKKPQTKSAAKKSAATVKTTAKTKIATTEKPQTAATAKAQTEAAKPAEQRKQSYSGKWVIVKDEDGKYFAKLLASNGGVLIKTESYSSLSGAKNGIQTIKKNVDGGNFATSIDKYGRYSFKLFSMSNRLIFRSEDYSSKAKCESAINSVKRFAKTETLVREDLS